MASGKPNKNGEFVYAKAADGGSMTIIRKGKAKGDIKVTGESTNVSMYQAVHKGRMNVLEDGEAQMKIEIVGKSEKEEDPSNLDEALDAENRIHITITLIEKKERIKASFLPSQKLSDLRKYVKDKYGDITFEIFNSDGRKLDETKTFQDHKIKVDDEITLGNPVCVSLSCQAQAVKLSSIVKY